MPIGLSKAPKTLPKTAKQLWVDTFNGVFENCEGPEKECDARAARIAWDQIKRKYRKVKDDWIAKSEYEDSYHDVLLTITKASLQPDGSVRWQAVASDTGKDKSEERTSLDLFQDWIDRVTYKADVGYLPAPKMPFLGVSHYPALDGFGEAGITRRMYVDGNTFKADGVFRSDSMVGQKLLDAVKTELAMIKKGDQPEKPIRISAGWWDIQHYHDDSNFLFTRQALTDKCPLCEQGQTSDKVYKAGQLDHFAATRVPMNPRTSLELEEKSMAKITRREDAESIIGSDEAAEMERRARMVGKSESGEEDELHSAMVTRAATKIGSFIKRKREEAEMSIVDLAAKTEVTDGTIGDIESGVIKTPSKPVIADIAKALKVSQDDLLDLLPSDAEPADTVAKADVTRGGYMRDMRRKKKLDLAEVAKRMKAKEDRLRRLEDDEEEMDEETMADFATALKMSDEEKEEMLARFGKKRRKTPPVNKGETETFSAVHYDDLLSEASAGTEIAKAMGNDEGEMKMPMAPLGGAISLKEADDYIQAQERMDQMYSYWDMLQIAFGNIKRDEEITDKMKAVSSLFREMASKIDTLKAGLSDAFLIQESAAAYEDYEDADEDYEDYEDEIEYPESDEVNTMSEETTNLTSEIGDPEAVLLAARKAALENKALTREEREAAIQDAFNEYAESVKGQLQEADPIPQADQIATAIKGALADVLTPLAEQVGLLTAKMGSVDGPQPMQAYPGAPVSSGVTQMHEVYVPQQKSMMAPPTMPQPVQPVPGMPVSPVTGKPSALTAKIRKSVGLHS